MGYDTKNTTRSKPDNFLDKYMLKVRTYEKLYRYNVEKSYG